MLSDNKILIKKNNISGVVPHVSSIDLAELGVNTVDGKLFTKTINGSITSIVSFLNDNDYPYTLNHYYSSVNFKYGNNTVNQVFASVLNGYNNDITGGGSSVINGENNDIAGDFSLIGSGLNNKINVNGDYSFIAAGSGNLINHQNVFVLGSGLSSHSSDFTYVNNISATGKIYANGIDITSGSTGNTDVTTTVRSNSANWDSTYTTFKNSSSNFITQVNANYLPLSGGTINGNLYVTQTLSSAKTVYSEEFAYNSTERPDLTGVKQALDELLYTSPVFNSLTVNGGNSLEVGQSINTPNVSWTTNKTFNSITLTFPNGTTSSGNGSFLSISDPSSYTFSSSTGSKTWSVQGTDWKATTANRSTTVNWYYKVYMGAFNTTTPSSSDVLTNAQHSALGSTRTTLGSKSITLSNEYFYVAYPTAFGTTSQLKVNGLNFTDLASVYTINPFTNSSGGTASYYVYRTNNKLTGTYTMEVL